MESAPKPSLFIGSTEEDLDIARALGRALRQQASYTVWDGTFPHGITGFEGLLKLVETYDFAIFVASPSDVCVIDGKTRFAVRDNIILEYGMFLSKLGPDRVFIFEPDIPSRKLTFEETNVLGNIYPAKLELPSDLGSGYTVAKFDASRNDENWDEAVQIDLTQIKKKLKDFNKKQVDTRFRALLILDCVPHEQFEVIKRFDGESNEEVIDLCTKYNIEMIERGVILGKPDDFVLISAPSYEELCKFITQLRAKIGGNGAQSLVRDIQTQIVFANIQIEDKFHVHYWERSKLDGDGIFQTLQPNYLILVSCIPQCVNSVMNNIVKIAKKNDPNDFIVTHVGVVFGTDDLFILLHCKTNYVEFLNAKDGLKKYLPHGTLYKNQSTLTIVDTKND